MGVGVRSILFLVFSATIAPGCMTASEVRREKATVAALRARLDARGDLDRRVAQEIAALTHAFEDVQARWVPTDEDTKVAAARMEREVAALDARTDQLADVVQRQAQSRADASGRLEKRLVALEKSDADLADRVGLFLPDNKDELWRQAMALLTAGQRARGRRYCQAFIDRFPQDSRASQAYLAIGRAYADETRYSEAAATYQRLLSIYPAAPEVPEAMWQLSRTFAQLSFCSDARAVLRDLIGRYPRSPEATEAAKQLRAPKQASGVCVS